MGRIAEGKSPTIKQLRPWHRSMARMMVAEGKRPGELAQIFGLSPAQVTIITNSPLFIAERRRLELLADYEAVDVRAELESRQGLAVQNIDLGLIAGDLKMRVNTALEVLDRTGFGKKTEPQKHAHLHLHAEIKDMSDEELAKEALKMAEGGE